MIRIASMSTFYCFIFYTKTLKSVESVFYGLECIKHFLMHFMRDEYQQMSGLKGHVERGCITTADLHVGVGVKSSVLRNPIIN